MPLSTGTGPHGDQGKSLLPLARGDRNPPHRSWALFEYRNSGHPYDPPVHATMLRWGRYMVVAHHGPPVTDRAPSGELYDLETDPQELRNLWDDPATASTRVQLERLLLEVLVATEERSQPREAFW